MTNLKLNNIVSDIIKSRKQEEIKNNPEKLNEDIQSKIDNLYKCSNSCKSLPDGQDLFTQVSDILKSRKDKEKAVGTQSNKTNSDSLEVLSNDVVSLLKSRKK